MSPGGNARGEQAGGLFTAKPGASKQSQGDHAPSKRNFLLCTKRNFSRFGYRVPTNLTLERPKRMFRWIRRIARTKQVTLLVRGGFYSPLPQTGIGLLTAKGY